MPDADHPAEHDQSDRSPSPAAGAVRPNVRTDIRVAQQRRFWHHLLWSAAGSTALAIAVYLMFGALWPTLSFLALMLMMSVFFAAYYAMLRIE